MFALDLCVALVPIVIRIEECLEQVECLRQDFADYQPFFEGMRKHMKFITQYVNRRWKVQTPQSAPVKQWMGSEAPLKRREDSEEASVVDSS